MTATATAMVLPPAEEPGALRFCFASENDDSSPFPNQQIGNIANEYVTS